MVCRASLYSLWERGPGLLFGDGRHMVGAKSVRLQSPKLTRGRVFGVRTCSSLLPPPQTHCSLGILMEAVYSDAV